MEGSLSKRGRGQGDLLFSESKIELNLKLGDIYEGYFEMECSTGSLMEGYVYSSSVRMQPGVRLFSGTKVAVPYEFNTCGMQQGDVLRGNFMIVSDIGEYVLPFVASIAHETLDSSLGSIRNLFHFTNLAKSNWNEAVDVFYSPDFADIITGQDAGYRDLYKGLTAGGNRNHNLEEFLIGINKKKIIEYSVPDETLRIVDTGQEQAQTIKITRNGWGYSLLAVKGEGDFIRLSKPGLKNEDFEGNICEYEFVIDPDRLHPGKNIGRINFRHLYGRFSVDIVVVKEIPGVRYGRVHREKTALTSLLRHYLDYRMGLIDNNKWAALSQEFLAHRASMDSDDVGFALCETFLLLKQERFNEAKWLLDRKIEPVIEDESNEMYCFYLYLTSLYNADEYYTREISGTISGIYERDPGNWRIAWVLLQVSSEFKRNPSRMYAFAMKQLSAGCNSPLLYMEIVSMLQAMPSLLMHFDEEEIHLLMFAAKNKLVSMELREQIAYRAVKAKDYDKRIVRILKNLYDSNPTDNVLEAICTQLIRGDKTGDKYFEWYAEGVKRGFQITRLYEYYLISAGDRTDITIPQDVLMYFTYDNDMPYIQKAYLYAYIVRHKNELPDIYVTYKSTIERFVLKQLYAGRVNRDLAYLYMELVVKEMATPDNLHQLSELLLVHMIRVDDPSIVAAIVIDERLKQELVFPVSSGRAYVTLLGSEYTVLLEDTLGNRFFGTKEYITERYFLPKKLLPVIDPYAEDSLYYNLYVCEGNLEYITVTERNASRYYYLEQCEEVSDEFRTAIRLPLIRYYKDTDDTAMLDGLLDRMDKDDVPPKDRNELLRLMILRGFTDKAYEYALYYGPESIDAQVLVRLTSSVIDRDGLIEDENLTAMAMSAFERGKYNETGLQYLVEFYRGPVKNLRNIWKAASGFYLDTYSICENMIAQTLKTGAYIGEEVRILKEYVEGGAKTDLELEYLTYFADGYFVSDRMVDEFFFTEMARIYENEHELPVVCMLAFLKYYAYNVRSADLSENTIRHIIRYIHVLYAEKNMILPFMQAFEGISAEAGAMGKLTVVEYSGAPGCRVTINYYISSENDESVGYIRDEMKEVYGGIYTKSFLLFFGETVQYYITEENNGIEELTESGTASRNDVDSSDCPDRYDMINDIAMATTLKDYDTALKLAGDYKEKEYLCDSLFAMQ